jgi:Flp pilus assembly protein TadB
VLGSAAASAFLIAPSAHHRLRFRAGSKERMLKAANALAIAGMVALAFSMACVVYVISSVLHSSTTAAVITAVVALGIAGLWFVLPLTYPSEGEDRPVP